MQSKITTSSTCPASQLLSYTSGLYIPVFHVIQIAFHFNPVLQNVSNPVLCHLQIWSACLFSLGIQILDRNVKLSWTHSSSAGHPTGDLVPVSNQSLLVSIIAINANFIKPPVSNSLGPPFLKMGAVLPPVQLSRILPDIQNFTNFGSDISISLTSCFSFLD